MFVNNYNTSNKNLNILYRKRTFIISYFILYPFPKDNTLKKSVTQYFSDDSLNNKNKKNHKDKIEIAMNLCWIFI